jgi:hypothetical protein
VHKSQCLRYRNNVLEIFAVGFGFYLCIIADLGHDAIFGKILDKLLTKKNINKKTN